MTREGPLLVKHNQTQILFQRDLALLEDLECEVVTSLHLGPLQSKVLCSTFTGQMIPPIGKKNATYIQKYTSDFRCFLHRLSLRRHILLTRYDFIDSSDISACL